MFEKAIEIIMAEPPELHYPAYYADLLRQADAPGICVGELPSTQPETHDKCAETHACDLVDRQAVIDLLKQMRKDGDMVPWEGKDVFTRIRKLPSAEPETCEGCKHLGNWENEVECGVPSPCTLCKRRAEDWYER